MCLDKFVQAGQTLSCSLSIGHPYAKRLALSSYKYEHTVSSPLTVHCCLRSTAY